MITTTAPPQDLYDSAVAVRIPATARRIAGYIDGPYAWTPAGWDDRPGALAATIATRATTNAGDVLDVEKGDATPDQAGDWIRRRKQAGLWVPTIYVSRASIPQVRQGTGTYQLGKDYDIWVADWTGSPHLVTAAGPGLELPCAVTQYENTPLFDRSAVYDPRWPRRAEPATPTVLAALQTLANYLQPAA